MPVRVIRLRYAGTCIECGGALPEGTSAWWDSGLRSTTCQGCRASTDRELEQSTNRELAIAQDSSETRTSPAAGKAGASARREYEKRHHRRDQKINRQWGRLSGFIKLLSDDPQSTKAFAKGSEGERRLAAHLRQALGNRAVLLEDRKVPGTRGNIDLLAIAASGIWVIDAKHYKGMVETRDVGGWFKTDVRLYVGGRDRTKMAGGLAWQIDVVRKAIGGADIPISAALCFIESDWKLLAKPIQYRGVWVTWAKKLGEMIVQPGPLTSAEVTLIANRLAVALPPKAFTS